MEQHITPYYCRYLSSLLPQRPQQFLELTPFGSFSFNELLAVADHVAILPSHQSNRVWVIEIAKIQPCDIP